MGMGSEVWCLLLQLLQTTDNTGEVFAVPQVKVDEEELAEQPRERSNTMPSVETEKADGVVLRVSEGPRSDPDKRKSGNNNVSQQK